MRSALLLGCGVAAGLFGPAAGAGPIYLSAVESPVYEVAGNAEAIARKADLCIAKLVNPGLTTASTVLSKDLAGGVIVARNVFEYRETVWGRPLTFTARTKLTFEAREGRFRVTHGDIEVFNQEWRPIRAAKPGKVDEMREQLVQQAGRIAECVKAPVADW